MLSPYACQAAHSRGRPAKAVRMRANGEMDIENGDTAAAFSDFMRAMRLARELLALR